MNWPAMSFLLAIDTHYRRKRSGSMPAGRVRRHVSITGMIRATINWGNMPGIPAIVEARRIRLERNCPTIGDCMTCTGMYGNGVQTGMQTLTPMPDLPTPKAGVQARPVFCTVAVGSTIPETAGHPAATGTSPATEAAVSGFVSWWTWRGVYNE